MAELVVPGEGFCSPTSTVITLLKKRGGGFSVIDNATNNFLLDISSTSTFHRRTIISDMSKKPIFTVKRKEAFGEDSWLGIKGEEKKSSSNDVSFEASASKHKRPIIDVSVGGRHPDNSNSAHPQVRVACLNHLGILQFTSNQKIFAEMILQNDSEDKIDAMTIRVQDKNVDYAFISSIGFIVYEVYKDLVPDKSQRSQSMADPGVVGVVSN